MPTLPGNVEQLLRRARLQQSDFHKIDTKITYNASSRLNLNGRFSYLPASELAAGLYGARGRKSAGARHDPRFERQQRRDLRDEHRLVELRH